MTINISDNNPRISYSVASGVTQSTFTVPFEFFDDSDLNVYVDGILKTITSDYTVSGGDGSTGTVTMSVTGVTSGSTVVLTRDTTIERVTDFTAGVDINRAALNTQLDTLTAISADVKDLAERSIRVEDLEIAPNLVLPSIANRADKLLSFDTEGAVTAQSAADLLTGSVLGANYTKASHTGDGTSVAFGTTEAAGSKNNIQVYIDGVYQNKDTFSISGSTLTFSEAPPLNSAIEFIVGNAVTSITGDASAITYDQGGTGSVERTTKSKLQETVSVKDFGAVGDGVMDDWAAINAAVDHLITLGGGTMYFPQGSYYVSQTINVFKAPGYVTGFNLVGESREETSIITDQDIVLIEHAESFRLRDISLFQTGTAKTGIGTATNVAKQTAYGEWRNVNIANFGYGIWWSYSLWCSVRDVRINNCGVGIRLSRNHNKTQATSNAVATGAWNVGWFQNVNTFDNVLINGGEVGIWGSPTGLVMNNVTCQGQSGDGSSNTVAPVGVKGTGLWLQNNGSNTSAFGVLGNVANGYYTEYTQQPIVSEYVPLIVNGGYFQGNTNVAPYPQVVKTIGATIELNNCSGADWFEYQVYADAGTVIGNTGGAVNTGTQQILNNGQYYRNGFPRGGVEYFPISVTGASTTTVASFEGYGEPVRIDVAGIYDGYIGKSASFLAIRTPGSVNRVQAEAGNSTDITCTISGSAIQINTTGGLAYNLYITITKMRQMTGSQVY